MQRGVLMMWDVLGACLYVCTYLLVCFLKQAAQHRASINLKQGSRQVEMKGGCRLSGLCDVAPLNPKP